MSLRFFGKGRKPHPREPIGSRHAVLVDYRMSRVSVGHLDAFYERSGFPDVFESGMMAHVSGVLGGEETVYLSIWDDEDTAVAAWRRKRADIAEVLEDAPPDAEISRRSSPLYRIYAGDGLGRLAAPETGRRPSVAGVVIDLPQTDIAAYELVCGRMDFPDDWPDGLLLHFAGPVEDVLRVVSIWRRAEDSREFFESRLIPAALAVAREKGLFPEIRPVDLRVHMLVLGEKLND